MDASQTTGLFPEEFEDIKAAANFWDTTHIKGIDENLAWIINRNASIWTYAPFAGPLTINDKLVFGWKLRVLS